MSDVEDDTGTASTPEPSFGAPVEHALVRVSIWQTVLSLVGIFVAIVALYAALTESSEMRRQTAAAVWPYVQLSVQNHLTEADALFAISLTNAGVGPARMRAMQVEIRDVPMTDWNAVLGSLTDRTDVRFNQNYSRNRVLSPGEEVVLFAVWDPDVVAALTDALERDEARIGYCYCSIFDACWLAQGASGQTPEEVGACPDYGNAGFRF